ncbi:hypothetical protein PVAP13_3KG060700 [Panicum virgatum]|uniref:DUF7866 domain-containing protein n=2 Tax=Panicum virgatum TaxID=38727 RepID=A0A8T0UM99_PANVG|nr:hypothetical protein PVAP13_3KG060700 [Panicum virgatum]
MTLIHNQQTSMAKATKLFLGSVILLLYTGLFIQGATEYADIMEHIPTQSMKTPDPWGSLAPIQYRKVCAPCTCCPGNSSKSCYAANKCCRLLTCNGPNQPIGTCSIEVLACNCNNCV